ncbi:unannotated protein [freshwater metagenome]|uniref:Unannotated protein n=1 Tax=freshwater metagenome TaxID=449393 RepID=A0A6J7EVA4_9ZZZZ|nr:hypothetical protein [Actinomycetota bacterium]
MNAEALLELQLVDTAIDQLRYRMGRLPEVIAADAADAAVVAWKQRSAMLHATIVELEAAIAVSEKESAAISVKRDRLDKQLKTVISPREAEALMHEIATLSAQRSVLDDGELEAMEAVAAGEAELSAHHDGHDDVHDDAAAARALGDQVVAVAMAEVQQLSEQRDTLRAKLEHSVLERYDGMRAQFNGVAVAKLSGLQCGGCHLDMSRGEIDGLKRDQSGDVPECPNCGRLLVL